MRFEILEHTADVGVRAFGRTLPELFENAAFGLESIALDPGQVRPEASFALAASGEDREALLVNWLNEIVYYLDARHVAFARFDVEAMTDGAIAAHGWGERRDIARHPSRLVVKAATHHQLRIEQTSSGWTAEFYMDI